MQGLELETVELRLQERVAWITLNRPDALNALTPQMGRELGTAFEHAAESSEARAIVLTGAGRGFSRTIGAITMKRSASGSSIT
jgi:enoyl-CoA hydratase/carnithine racemase